MGLDKFLRSPVSDDLSTSIMVNRPKPCWNVEESTFTIFVDHSEGNSVRKNLSEWYAHSEDCLLIHWLPITSSVFLLETIYSINFRCNYLRSGKYLINFFSIFKIKIHSWQFSKKKKMNLIADVFLNLRTSKDVDR